MNRLRKALIGKQTEIRLKNHGLMLDVNWDNDAEHPDSDAKASFAYSVANAEERDTLDFFFGDHGFDIGVAVAHHCNHKLGCDVSEIIWLPIYEDGDDYINYSTEPFYDSELSGVVGFVYARKDSGVADTEQGFHDYFKERLSINSDWRNGRVFRLYLITDGVDEGEGGIAISLGGLYSSDYSIGEFTNTVDEAANKMIDKAIAMIDASTNQVGDTVNENSANNISTLVVELTVDQSKIPDNVGVTRYIVNEIEKRCRVKVAIGSFVFIEEREHLTAKFLFSALPLLSALEKQSNKSLIDEIQVSQREWGAKEDRIMHTMDKMLNAKSYEEYDSYMMMALMRVLFGTPDGVIMNIAHRQMVR